MKHLALLTLPPQIINKSWISRKNEKAVKLEKAVIKKT